MPTIIVGLAALIAVVSVWPRSTGLSFSDMAVTPAPEGETASVYFTVSRGGASDTVVSASSPDAGWVTLHDTDDRDGGSFMVDVETLDVPAGGSLVLAPGGRHVMLHDVARRLVPGDEVEVTLEFRDEGTRTIRLPVLEYVDLAELPGAGGSG